MTKDDQTWSAENQRRLREEGKIVIDGSRRNRNHFEFLANIRDEFYSQITPSRVGQARSTARKLAQIN